MKYILWGLIAAWLVHCVQGSVYVKAYQMNALGTYTCKEEIYVSRGWFFDQSYPATVCSEKLRCGGPTLQRHQYVECGGVVAVCATRDYGWGSLEVQMGSDNEPIYSITPNRTSATRHTWTKFSNGIEFDQAEALARLCV